MSQTALYVHIPFCLRKCSYCGFNSYAGLDHLHEPYIDALVSEIASAARQEGPVQAASVYLGGGTPTVLDARLLGKVLQACADHHLLLPGAEITIEANPGTVDAAYLSPLKALGVSRLSFGVQTFDEEMLALLGRIHGPREALQTFSIARQAGFENINVDLIYGLPAQRLDLWEADLSQAISLRPEHLSLYCLSLEPGTPLAELVSRGELPSPDGDLAAAMYERAQERLREAGFVHYEISNWAMAGRECQHNIRYWRNRRYRGFGAGAHSFDGRSRCHNVLPPQEYVRRLQGGGDAVVARELIDSAAEMGETMIMGLRLCRGVSFDEFQRRFGVPLVEVYGDQIQELTGLGLLEVDLSGVRLTRRGLLLGNEVFERFLVPDAS